MSVRGLEFREKVNPIKAAAFFPLCSGLWSLSVFFICVLGSGRLTQEHNGSDTIIIA